MDPAFETASSALECSERGKLEDVWLEVYQEVQAVRAAAPWDNAACESFLKTLPGERVYGSESPTWPKPAPACASSWMESTTRETGTGFLRPKTQDL